VHTDLNSSSSHHYITFIEELKIVSGQQQIGCSMVCFSQKYRGRTILQEKLPTLESNTACQARYTAKIICICDHRSQSQVQ